MKGKQSFRNRALDILDALILIPLDTFTAYLMRHPLATLLLQLVLIVATAYLTTLLLVFLRMAGYIP